MLKSKFNLLVCEFITLGATENHALELSNQADSAYINHEDFATIRKIASEVWRDELSLQEALKNQ